MKTGMTLMFAAAALIGIWIGVPSEVLTSSSDVSPPAEPAATPAKVEAQEDPESRREADTVSSEAPPAPAPAPAQQDRKGHYADDFAALNAQREGVVTLPSGVQYEVLEAGSGRKPEPGETVLVRYEASLADGRIFDTTEAEPEPRKLELESIAVPGLREALLLMPAGSRWRVVIPPSQGYGRSGNNMLRRRDVIYDIHLVSIDSPH